MTSRPDTVSWISFAIELQRAPKVENFEWSELLFNEWRLEVRGSRTLVATRPGLGGSLSEQANA